MSETFMGGGGGGAKIPTEKSSGTVAYASSGTTRNYTVTSGKRYYVFAAFGDSSYMGLAWYLWLVKDGAVSLVNSWVNTSGKPYPWSASCNISGTTVTVTWNLQYGTDVSSVLIPLDE